MIDNVKSMLDAKWFKVSNLNFAENLLKNKTNNIAIEFYDESGSIKKTSYNELYDLVSSTAQYLKKIGIIPCGRYGIWAYLWSDEAILSGKKAVEILQKI